MLLNYRSIRVPGNLDIVISSYGGSGTTSLMRFVSEFHEVNNLKNHDLLKHSARPPVTLNPGTKFIYIFGDPINSVISLFRRDLHHPHSKKLALVNPGKSRLIRSDMTLEEYAKGGCDLLGLQNHFMSWNQPTTQNDILFIRMETMHQHLETILDFLEIDRKEAERFPQKYRRRSDPDSLPTEVKEGLQNIYSDFRNHLNSIPDIYLKKGISYNTFDRTKLFFKWVSLLFREWLVMLKKSLKSIIQNVS